METVLKKIYDTIHDFKEHVAIRTQDDTVSYGELHQRIAIIQEILSKTPMESNEIVAIYCDGSFDTYAGILGLWFSRKAYLPITPNLPEQRILEIIKEAKVKYVLVPEDYSGFLTEYSDIQCIRMSTIDSNRKEIHFPDTLSGEDVMYVLFTSGSTGKPKGVPISRKNIDAFVDGFFGLGYELDHRDRFLQMFEFTFDVSVQCYVLPLCIGASICQVPNAGIKYLETLKVLREKEVTIAKMVPSTIQFLKPYFNEISLPHLKYSLFSGEGLGGEITDMWSKVVPQATIQNFYGPTEATIDCTYYTFPKGTSYKAENDVVSIGKPFGDTHVLVIGEDGSLMNQEEKGELCVSGDQVTSGYLNNDLKNSNSFFTDDNGRRYYKTGDLVYVDNQRDLQYCGRLDDQVQIQGHRVELEEISFRAGKIAGKEAKAIAVQNHSGLWEIHLAIEAEKVNLNSLLKELKMQLPGYMIPIEIYAVPSFPYNSNGKLDRKQLKEKMGI